MEQCHISYRSRTAHVVRLLASLMLHVVAETWLLGSSMYQFPACLDTPWFFKSKFFQFVPVTPTMLGLANTDVRLLNTV